MKNVIITVAFAITLGVAIAALLYSVQTSASLLKYILKDAARWEFTAEFSDVSMDWMIGHAKLHDQINLDEEKEIRRRLLGLEVLR